MPRNNIVWWVVGVLLVICLIIFIIKNVNVT